MRLIPLLIQLVLVTLLPWFATASSTTGSTASATTGVTSTTDAIKSTSAESTSASSASTGTSGPTTVLASKATSAQSTSASTPTSANGPTTTQSAEPTSTKSTSASKLTSTRQPTTLVDCHDDPNVNCEKLKPQCSDHRYNDLTDKYCARTCNRCAGPALPTCYDASDNCEAWNRNGFCNSTFNPPERKMKYCEKTCGFCT